MRKIEKTGIHFKTDVFAAAAVPVVDAKAPYYSHHVDSCSGTKLYAFTQS